MLQTIRMTFKTDEDKLAVISVPRANESVADLAVKGAMQALIAAGIISTANGNLFAAEKAELISKDIYEFTY